MTEEPADGGTPPPLEVLVERAFGEENRRRMLMEYFRTAGEVTPSNAWTHVYRLLLWIDPTTGLAHCYESDKSQPGRPWYERSLAFHDWVSQALGTTPSDLAGQIDRLFKRATEMLAASIAGQMERRASRVAGQRKPYQGRGMPPPGEDLVLERIIQEELGTYFSQQPSATVMQRLTERVWTHFRQENKRKNLVGEGFEDVLSFLISRLPGADRFQLPTRRLLSQLPGYRKPPEGQKERKVDLAILGSEQERTLVSAKWSVRADREEQFRTDYTWYTRLNDWRQSFGFVLVTNEFDAARLVAACDSWGDNTSLFSTVVHVNPMGPLVVYPRPRPRDKAATLHQRIESRRLTSLEQWLTSLLSEQTG